MSPLRHCSLLATLFALTACAGAIPVAEERTLRAASRAPQPTAQAAEDADDAQAPRQLVLARADEEGRTLHLRAAVYEDGLGLPEDPVAIYDGREPAELSLAPGRYRVMVFAEPGPFGFSVNLEEERELTSVFVFSAARGHTVVVDARRFPLADGRTLVERRILGFGWGARPDPLQPAQPGVEPGEAETLFRETLERVERALEARSALEAGDESRTDPDGEDVQP